MSNSVEMPLWVTAKRAKELFGIGRTMLELWVKQGRVQRRQPATRKVLYSGPDIDRAIKLSGSRRRTD